MAIQSRPSYRAGKLSSKWSDYLPAGFFLFDLLSTVSGPFHSLLAPDSFPECPGMGQCFPDLHLLQLSRGGWSTTF